jgi:hypothetical protein
MPTASALRPGGVQQHTPPVAGRAFHHRAEAERSEGSAFLWSCDTVEGSRESRSLASLSVEKPPVRVWRPPRQPAWRLPGGQRYIAGRCFSSTSAGPAVWGPSPLLMTKAEIKDLAPIPAVVIICLNPREARVEVLGMTRLVTFQPNTFTATAPPRRIPQFP